MSDYLVVEPAPSAPRFLRRSPITTIRFGSSLGGDQAPKTEHHPVAADAKNATPLGELAARALAIFNCVNPDIIAGDRLATGRDSLLARRGGSEPSWHPQQPFGYGRSPRAR